MKWRNISSSTHFLSLLSLWKCFHNFVVIGNKAFPYFLPFHSSFCIFGRDLLQFVKRLRLIYFPSWRLGLLIKWAPSCGYFSSIHLHKCKCPMFSHRRNQNPVRVSIKPEHEEHEEGRFWLWPDIAKSTWSVQNFKVLQHPDKCGDVSGGNYEMKFIFRLHWINHN